MPSMPSHPIPKKVIFDTDMSIDVDDGGALCVLHALANRNVAEILAPVHDSASPRGAAALSVINDYYRRMDVLVGSYGGRVGQSEGTSHLSPWGFYREPPWPPWQVGPYVEDLVANFSSRVRDASTADGSSLAVLRRTLAAQPDRSVQYVSVGYATNLHDLLLSSGDAHSPLSGAQLVASKVEQVVIMGGRKNHIEWNIAGAEENGIGVCGGPAKKLCGQHNHLGAITNRTLEMLPAHVPLVWADFETGVDVWTGGVLAERAPPDSPCRAAYAQFCDRNVGWCQGTSRCSFDIVALLYAVRGAEGYYTLERGHQVVDPTTALSQWTPAADRTGAPRVQSRFGLFKAAARGGDQRAHGAAATAATVAVPSEACAAAPPPPSRPSPPPPPPPVPPTPTPAVSLTPTHDALPVNLMLFTTCILAICTALLAVCSAGRRRSGASSSPASPRPNGVRDLGAQLRQRYSRGSLVRYDQPHKQRGRASLDPSEPSPLLAPSRMSHALDPQDPSSIDPEL